jgi:hypothetical protein
LNSAGARYVIVGGYAVAFHGYPRYTGDLDFFVEASESNGQLLEHVIQRFGFAEGGLTAADFNQPDAIIQLGRPPNRIDVVTGLDGVTFAEAWATKVPGALGDLPVPFISKELLIRNKRAAGRAQDLADAEKLEQAED